MPTSVYFNNQNASREQFLLEDLIVESIKNHGIDVYYIPRDSHSSIDELFGDDPVKKFSEAYTLEVYLESFNTFDGNEEFFSKFGLEINKGMRIAMSRRSFEKQIPTSTRNVPKEGDLIWFPTQLKLMEIKFVEEEKNFFQLGRGAKNPYMYGLTVETFRYNGEIIDTGIPEVDDVSNTRAIGVDFTVEPGGIDTFELNEIVYQGDSIETATAKGYVSDWNRPTRTLKIRNIKGEFTPNVLIKGLLGGAFWTLSGGNTMENANDSYDDNVRIENEADNILDFSETNPFGEP